MATPGYQPRVRVNVGRADPVLGPQTAIAEGVQQLGGAVGRVADDRAAIADARAASQYRIDAEQQRRDRSAMIATKAGEFAVLQGELKAELDEARQTATPGAPEWGGKAKSIADAKLSKFIEGLPDDPEIRERYEPMIADFGMRIIGRENDWAAGKKAEHEGNSVKALHAQIALQAQEDGNVKSAFGQFDTVLDGLDMDATSREAVRLQGKRDIVDAVLGAATDRGQYDQVLAALGSDEFKPYLTPDSADRFRTDVTRGQERAARAAEAAEAEQVRAARETAGGVMAKLERNIDPTPQELAAARAAIKLLKPEEQVEYADLEMQLGVNRDTRGMAVAAIRLRRDALQERENAGKASQADQLQLRAFNKRLDSAETDEAEKIKALSGGGMSAFVEGVQDRDPATRAALAEKGFPGKGAEHIVNLPTPAIRQSAVEGMDILKDRPDLVDKDAASRAYASRVGIVERQVGQQYGAKMDVAKGLYANWAARTGTKKFDPAAFGEYVNVAFGATRRADGAWQGGLGAVNGQQVILPDRLTAAELRSTLARTDWSAARDARGNPVPKSFIVQRMYPVLVGEDDRSAIYHLEGPGGKLGAANGQPIVWRVAKGIGR